MWYVFKAANKPLVKLWHLKIIRFVIKQTSPSGQLSKTNWAISPAESLALNKNSSVFPLTSINRRLI